ncbi:DNA polymerase III subunit beta [Thermospira aquatica]|uniref:Beta sliding clamp n=1 Tax=Thermospira aquatica TaxID=2828656 RepID=A0AAX3BFD5_9SPIR|nr:DNA polymerase III subunit beta [Thermospira aquatica]URA10997.1 DNA polymerase III subunit beta [Thermospira aquatica]
MKFTVNRDEFFHLLSLANEVINPKNPLTILANLYLSVSKDGLVIMQGYNGEHGIKLEMTGDVEEAGTVLLHARKFFDVVSKITTPHICISSGETGSYELTITSPENNSNFYKLHGGHAENFPTFQEYTWENYIAISQESLYELIDMTEYAVSGDSAKIYLTGFYMEESVEGWLTFVTTDGKRLALLSREYEKKVGEVQDKVIIPGSLMKIIKKSLSTGDARIAIRGQNVFFKIGNVYLFSGLLDGKFPNYRDVIPSLISYTAEIGVEDFRRQLESVGVLSDGDVPKVFFELLPNQVNLSSVNAIYGEARASFEIHYEGEPLQFSLNYRHLMDFLRVVKSSSVLLHIKSTESPIKFGIKGDENFIYLVMPIKGI